MSRTGLVHLYCGDGKGKTTCAMGLALRCASYGDPTVIVQFLKDGTSGESRMLARLENVTLLAVNPCHKFVKAMTEAEREQCKQAVSRTFHMATDFVVRNHARMLVLDEVCAAVTNRMLEEQVLLDFLENKPKHLEIVMTGRNPTLCMQQSADYISEIHKKKHPFDQGIHAREGIEK